MQNDEPCKNRGKISGEGEGAGGRTNKLPGKPSELIRVAVRDLQSIRQDDRYLVNMYTWHTPASSSDSGKCEVCFAGAVMSRSLGVAIDEMGIPTSGVSQLKALDAFRSGEVDYGLENLGYLSSRYPILDRYVTPYEASPRQFMYEMLGLAEDLEAVGL